ncbi:MAG: LacI family DNA-binding transcriptional regulator [Cytophagales bacterium]|nr:LacI family DNA-binding transcriptional regulator [Armatimonadota bacterium]
MPVSIREVAARAGVSLGTVSKVLNESATAQIASGTRDRVRRAASDLNYHPSAVARALVRKQMDTIGIVLPPGQTSPIRHPFFASLFDSVLQAAATHRQNTTIFTGVQWQNAEQSLRLFRDGRCDGLILFFQLPDSDIVSALVEVEMPLVLVDDVRDDPRVTCVDVDNVRGAREMTEYLLGLGHRRIALFLEAPFLNYVEPRRQGYLQALQAAGVSADPALILYQEAVGAENQLEKLLLLPRERRPTAIFCSGDTLAGKVLQTAAQLGLRVPLDLSVAGFNDDGTAERHYPPLTTMRQPYKQIGESAVVLLLEQVQDISARGQRRFLTAELVVRGSTAASSTGD